MKQFLELAKRAVAALENIATHVNELTGVQASHNASNHGHVHGKLQDQNEHMLEFHNYDEVTH